MTKTFDPSLRGSSTGDPVERTTTAKERRNPPHRYGESEKQFRARVVAYAALRGWRSYWTWNSQHSPAGFPDLVLVRPDPDGAGGRLIFAELKVGKNRVTQAQKTWLAELALCGQEVYLWRPDDWDDLARALI